MITGGGTGGHIFSSLTIANALKQVYEITFIGAVGGMELHEVRQAGYPIVGLWIRGLGRHSLFALLQNFLLPLRLLVSIVHAYFLLCRLRPVVMIGTGGYASMPALCAAFLRGVPVLLHEQNAIPGKVNTYAARWAKQCCVAYASCGSALAPSPWVLTGNPVRADLLDAFAQPDAPAINVERARAHFGLTAKPVILILGGSLGCYTFNRALLAHIDTLLARGWTLLWQVGRRDLAWITRSPAAKRQGVCALAFIDKMPLAYLAADVIVSRAGALTLSELCVVGKSVIVVPSPHVANNHQYANAKYFADREAVWLLTDDAVYTELVPALSRLLSDRPLREKLAANIRLLARRDATQQVAEEVLSLQKSYTHEGN